MLPSEYLTTYYQLHNRILETSLFIVFLLEKYRKRKKNACETNLSITISYIIEKMFFIVFQRKKEKNAREIRQNVIEY